MWLEGQSKIFLFPFTLKCSLSCHVALTRGFTSHGGQTVCYVRHPETRQHVFFYNAQMLNLSGQVRSFEDWEAS